MSRLLISSVILMLAAAAWLAATQPIDTTPILTSTGRAPSIGAMLGQQDVVQEPTDESALEVMIERPLFNPVRRPAEPALVKPSEATSAQTASRVTPFPDHLQLVGVIKTTAGARKALLRTDTADESFAKWLDVGAELLGWNISAIGDRQVTMRRGNTQHDLRLTISTDTDNPPPDDANR